MQRQCGIMVVALLIVGITFMTWKRHIMSARSVDWNPLSRSVPIELFVMSKCPDKVECEEVFSQVCKYITNNLISYKSI